MNKEWVRHLISGSVATLMKSVGVVSYGMLLITRLRSIPERKPPVQKLFL
ncbi:hypothetical protein [Okeania sp. KiyG1]|nr:hypothetical protein [Okeania sp. KiyG1]